MYIYMCVYIYIYMYRYIYIYIYIYMYIYYLFYIYDYSVADQSKRWRFPAKNCIDGKGANLGQSYKIICRLGALSDDNVTKSFSYLDALS